MNHNSGVTFHPTCLAKSLRLLKEHTLLPDQRLLSWRLLQSLCLMFYDSIRANVDELDEQVWNMQLWNVLSIIQDAAKPAKVWLYRHVSTCEPTLLTMLASNHAGHQKPGHQKFGNPKPTMKGCQNHCSTQPLENKLNILYIHIYTYRQSSLESSTDINIYTDLKLQNAVCWKNELQV